MLSLIRTNSGRLILLGFALRVLIAVWNGFFGPSFGADLDAASFQRIAIEYAHNSILLAPQVGLIYPEFLGLFYRVTIDSLFLGSLLSCAAWFASALVLARCLRVLSVEKGTQTKAMLVYALLPSSVMLTAVTLREPYELLFVNIAMYAAIKIYLYRVVGHWVTLVLATVGAGFLHGGLLAFGIIFVAGALLLVSIRKQSRIPWVKFLWLVPVAVVVLWYGFANLGNVSYKIDNGLGSAIETYQQEVLSLDARTDYKSNVSISGIWDLLFLSPVSLLKYWFEPFPWRTLTSSDAVVVLENILRGWLIVKASMMWRVSRGPRRRVALFIFLSYLAMETIWSVGTVNWGTAIRHHLPAMGLLLVAYAAAAARRRTTKIVAPVECLIVRRHEQLPSVPA